MSDDTTTTDTPETAPQGLDQQTFLSQVILSTIEGVVEHHGMKLSAETVLSYVTAVAAHATSAIDVESMDPSEETAYFQDAFLRSVRALCAHHGTKWSAGQVITGAETCASHALASRSATYEMLDRHREEEAKRAAQAEIASRVKSMTKTRVQPAKR
jgi:hypothetical protein